MARTAKKETVLTPEEKLAQALVPEVEQPYHLPNNWCWVKLGSISFHISDGSHNPPKDSGKGVPLLSATNIHDRIIDFEQTARWITNEEWMLENERTRIKVGDILLTIVATIGRVAVVTTEQPFALQRSVATIKPKINAQYLSYYLESPYVQTFMNTNAKGTAQKGFYLNSLENLFCVIPPLAEQQRIVDRIESLFAKLDEAKEKAQAVVDGFENRKAAILHKAFTGELTEKWRKKHGYTFSEWSIRKVSDVGDVITGSTPNTKKTEYYNGSIPFIKPTELNQGRYVISSMETLTEQGKAISRPIRAGSTCICCIGATISKCGLVSVDCVTNQQINSIVPYDFMDDVYVYYYCCSNKFKNELIGNSSATTLPIINKRKTSELLFVVPSKEEQHQIAECIDSLFEKEQQAKEAAEQVIDQIDTMKKAILARAFRGELGTNDPADESAVELLKRVL